MLAALLLAALDGGQGAIAFELVCTGNASMVMGVSSTGFISTPTGTATAQEFGTSRSETTVERVRIRVDGSASQIKLPASMRPPNIFDRRDDWWLLDAAVSPDRIEGRFTVNPINRPKVVIDRNTGDIDIRGGSFGTFSGSCERAATPSAPKF